MNNYARSTRYIAAFLRRHLPHLRKSPPEAILAWVQWHNNRGLTLVTRSGWRIVGVVLLRRVYTRDDAEDLYIHRDDGPIAFIDCAAVDRSHGMGRLFNLFYLIHGHKCSHMAWSRVKHDDRITVMPLRDALRLMAA